MIEVLPGEKAPGLEAYHSGVELRGQPNPPRRCHKTPVSPGLAWHLPCTPRNEHVTQEWAM